MLRGAGAAAAAAGLSACEMACGAAASPFAVGGELGRGWLVALKSSRTLDARCPTQSQKMEDSLILCTCLNLLVFSSYNCPQFAEASCTWLAAQLVLDICKNEQPLLHLIFEQRILLNVLKKHA